MVGLMNTLAQVGGLAGSVLYGYIVERTGSYDAPFIPMTVLLLVGAFPTGGYGYGNSSYSVLGLLLVLIIVLVLLGYL